MTTLDERAALAHMVIGADRREKILAQNADGLALANAMTAERARKYAEACFESADTVSIIRIGQVWARREGQKLPSDIMSAFFGRAPDETFTVHGFDGEMVDVGGGRHVNVCLFEHLWLVSWPEEFDLADEQPQPPRSPITEEDDTDSEEDGDRFDPRQLWVLAYRESEFGKRKSPCSIPILGAHYSSHNMHKPEYPPSYASALDVPAYLEEHLADYRAGYPDWLDQQEGDNWIDHFNELDGGPECELEVAAYMGHWLRQRVRSDVVTEYGGTVADYDVSFMWAPGNADLVLAVAPFADPEWEFPADHPLAQCEGQHFLFEAAGGAS
jgi:hypothetical protein